MFAKSTFSNTYLVVKGCSKAVLSLCREHGKSPCFLGMRFLWMLCPDWLVYNLMVVNGAKYLD
jgi:hypothetical protein